VTQATQIGVDREVMNSNCLGMLIPVNTVIGHSPASQLQLSPHQEGPQSILLMISVTFVKCFFKLCRWFCRGIEIKQPCYPQKCIYVS
jgi:hypothetical protein